MIATIKAEWRKSRFRPAFLVATGIIAGITILIYVLSWYLALHPSAAGERAEPIEMSPLPLFRLVKVTSCQDIGNAGWQDISGVAREGRLLIRIDNYRPFESVVVDVPPWIATVAPTKRLVVSGFS